jgi:hypothetical protein
VIITRLWWRRLGEEKCVSPAQTFHINNLSYLFRSYYTKRTVPVLCVCLVYVVIYVLTNSKYTYMCKDNYCFSFYFQSWIVADFLYMCVCVILSISLFYNYINFSYSNVKNYWCVKSVPYIINGLHCMLSV